MFLRRLYNYFFGPVPTAPVVEPQYKLVSQKENKREPIPLQVRNTVWETYHGIRPVGVCYCCGIPIERYNKGWHCSHVVSHNKNGPTTVENLRTCCRKCNLSMGNQNLYTFIRERNLKGPGAKNVNKYLKRHPSQIDDMRTNNWGHKK